MRGPAPRSAEGLWTAATTLLLAAVLTAWALLMPPYQAPDEPQHVSTALRLATGGGYPDPGEALIDDGVVGSFEHVGFPGLGSENWARVRAGEALRPSSADPLGAPSFRDLQAEGNYSDLDLRDQMTQHPPGYYVYLAAWTRVLGLDTWPVGAALLVLRLASALLVLPLPYLIVVVGRRLSLPVPARLAAALVPVAWVQFLHISSSVNNGTLLVTTTALVTALAMTVAGGDLRKRTGAALGAALSVALLSKGFALTLLPVVALAYGIAFRRRGTAQWAGAVTALSLSLPGLGWWVANLLRFGSVQPNGSTTPAGPRHGQDPDLVTWLRLFLDTLSETMWSNLGWLATPLPAPVHLVLTAAAVALVVAGSWRLRHLGGGLVLLHAAWLLPLGLVAYGSADLYLDVGVLRAAQGRYLQVGVLTFAVVVAAALPGRRWIAAVAPWGTALCVAAGTLYAFKRFWDPSTLGNVSSWWAHGDALLVSAAVVAAGSLGVLAVVGLTSRVLEHGAGATAHREGSATRTRP